MKHNCIFNRTHQLINRLVAIHEAGQATAIYLGNKQKRLPPVFFQIFITPVKDDFQSSRFLNKPNAKYIANIDGGRLIHTLPSSIEDVTDGFSPAQIIAYRRAFEADIVNILAGPLAEAKYIAQRGGEPINPHPRHLKAQYYFNGISELESINEYLECFLENSALRKQKITELFFSAFCFVNERSNWHAIAALADYIVGANKSVMECNEIIGVLEAAYINTVFYKTIHRYCRN